MPRVAVLIFAKYADPGSVNTRMVPPLSPEQAAAVHEASLLTVCELVATLENVELTLLAAPDRRCLDMHGITSEFVSDCRPQGTGDLGRRISRATLHAHTFAEAVIVLGADSPTLPRGYLVDAIRRLEVRDAVVGPCADGGYYLIGSRRPCPELFERINWGGSDVTNQTSQRAKEAGIDLHPLRPWYDLDRFEELPRAAADLSHIDAARRPKAEALRRLINRLIKEHCE